MQNVALAYKQTQAGTTGQDEVLLMLFDGVLRFLAQARDKIEVKDYAAKGILISRSLDIINELDSSLNMELGGELAKNLHQLYFLCTTRLLQANLKLDVEKLDSVVEILTGLRSAFAEVVARPEAKAACAQISARNAGKHANVTASRPLTSSGGQMPPGMNQGMNQAAQVGQAYGGAQTPVTSARTAAGMYGQQSQGQGAFVSAQTAVQIAAQPMAQAALLATQMVTQNALGGPAPQTNPQATSKQVTGNTPAPALGLRVPQAAQAYGQAAKPGENQPLSAPLATPLSAPQSAPLASQAAPAAGPATGGFAGKRLAVYGKPQGS